MYDIIIIGAGPAGMTAALYAKRALQNVLVLEAKNYGGKIINTNEINNYPVTPHITGYEFATKLYEQIKELNCEIKIEECLQIKLTENGKEIITNKNTYQTKTVIIATGTENRLLEIDKERALIGKGISYCATCDGAFYKQKEVAVIGGGNTALEDALYLSNIAKRVLLIHRRDSFRANKDIIEKVKEKKNIDIFYKYQVNKIIGENHLQEIEIINSEGFTKTIPVDGLFIAIGSIPNSKIVKEFMNIDKDGYILAGENCETNINGIFVAGDVRTKELRQLVTATNDGAIAAEKAIKYLEKERKNS